MFPVLLVTDKPAKMRSPLRANCGKIALVINGFVVINVASPFPNRKFPSVATTIIRQVVKLSGNLKAILALPFSSLITEPL